MYKCKDPGLTVEEALAQGWKEYDSALHRGYVSRRINIMKQPIFAAGGNRTGEFYYECPIRYSSQYLCRYYMKPPENYVPEKADKNYKPLKRRRTFDLEIDLNENLIRRENSKSKGEI